MREEPHSESYEKAALALILQHPESAGAVLRSSLTSEHFFLPHHRQLFDSIRQNHGEGEIAIVDKAMKSRAFVAVGGSDYFDMLKSTRVSEKKREEITTKLSELLCCRKLIEFGPRIVDAAYSGEYTEANVAVGSMMDDLSKTVKHEERGSHIKDCLNEVIEDVSKMSTGGQSICRPMGLSRLDSLTGGLITELILITGPTSSGKSALANEYLLSNGLDHNRPGVLFSYEMDRKTVTKRMVSRLSGVSLSKLMGISPDGGKITFRKDELIAIKTAVEKLSSMDLFIEDDVTMTVEDVWSRATELKALKGDMGCVAVDYIQLLPESNLEKGNTRERHVSHQGIKLKQLSKHLGCPVLGLSQLNRDFSVRESAALEQHAGNLYKVVRGEDPRSGEPIQDEHIYIWKNRNGERFVKIPIGFDGDRQRFYER